MNVTRKVRHKLGGHIRGGGRVDLRRVVADRAGHALVVRAVGRVHKGALPVGRVNVVQRGRPGRCEREREKKERESEVE